MDKDITKMDGKELLDYLRGKYKDDERFIEYKCHMNSAPNYCPLCGEMVRV
jgi:hypothetical protein